MIFEKNMWKKHFLAPKSEFHDHREFIFYRGHAGKDIKLIIIFRYLLIWTICCIKSLSIVNVCLSKTGPIC